MGRDMTLRGIGRAKRRSFSTVLGVVLALILVLASGLMIDSMIKPGFSFIEAISPCPTAHARRNKLGSGLDIMRYYKENSYLADKLDRDETALGLTGKIAVGKFVDVEKPTYLDMYNSHVLARATAKKKKKK